jgi:hypothetical protein
MASDARLAALARKLGVTLIRFAYDRRDDDRKQIAVLHTELCAMVRTEAEQLHADAKDLLEQ